MVGYVPIAAFKLYANNLVSIRSFTKKHHHPPYDNLCNQ